MSDRAKSVVAGCVAFVVVGVAMYMAYLKPQLDEVRQQREQKAVQAASSYAQTLRQEVAKSSSAVYAMAAALSQTDGRVSDFEALGQNLQKVYGKGANFQLLPDGVLTYIYPLTEGAKNALGLNVLTHPDRKPIFEKIRDEGKFSLAGPFELAEGGVGIVADLPVSLPDPTTGKDEFWGFSEVLYLLPTVLEQSNVSQLDRNGYSYELSHTNFDGKREVFATNTDGGEKLVLEARTKLAKPITEAIPVAGGGEWTLQVVPKTGWDATAAWWQWAFIVVISALAGALTFRLWEAQRRTRVALAVSEEAKAELADMALDLAAAKADTDKALEEAEKMKNDLAEMAMDLAISKAETDAEHASHEAAATEPGAEG